MRRLLKFLHTMGAIGLMGAMACLLVLAAFTPPPRELAQYALIRGAMGAIATWIFLPSMALTLIAGLLAIGINRAFHNAGWAWIKMVSGLIVFEWGFVGVQGPMQEEAELAARALAAQVAGAAGQVAGAVGQAGSQVAGQIGGQAADAAALAANLGAEQGSLWVLLAVATANVVLGVWRPKITRLKD